MFKVVKFPENQVRENSYHIGNSFGAGSFDKRGLTGSLFVAIGSGTTRVYPGPPVVLVPNLKIQSSSSKNIFLNPIDSISDTLVD